MCHGHVDLKTMEREVQERLRASVASTNRSDATCPGLPPELVGGLRGAMLRIGRMLSGPFARTRGSRAT